MSAIQVASLALMLLSAILLICCVSLPNWKVNDPADTIRDNIHRHEGLWLKCTTFSTGNWDCDDFNRFFLGLPVELQAGRGLGLASVAFALFAMISMLVGMDSIPCAKDNKEIKRRMRMIAGILAILSAFLIIGAVSWYANDIRKNHEFASAEILRNSSTTVYRYIFGYCLFIGWIGGVLMLIAGLFSLCTSCGGETYVDAQPRYAYRPATSKLPGNGQEYI